MVITESSNTEFFPSEFITIYSRKAHPHAEKYMEVGSILFINNKYEMGSSVPVSPKFLSDLVSTIKGSHFKALRFKGLIPENVIYYHSESQDPTIMWIRPAEKRYLYFSDHLKIESAEYQMPITLFLLHDKDLKVYRLLEEKLTDKTVFYYLPLPNIHEDSDVCLGGAKHKIKKPKSLEDVIKNYEDLFYHTTFNALHNDNFFDQQLIYNEVAKNKDIREWPAKQIKDLTLKKLMNEIS